MVEGSDRHRQLEDLKIDLLVHGLLLEPAARDHIALLSGGLLSVHEYTTTGGVTFVLEEDVYVNAPFDGPMTERPVNRLAGGEEGFSIEGPMGTFRVVRVLPLPGYLDDRDDHGDLVKSVAMSHTDRIRLSPIVGCAYSCRFCDLGKLEYQVRDADRLLRALAVGVQDPQLPVRHALISGGSPRRAQYEEFVTLCERVIEGSPIPVDVMFSPMIDSVDIVDRLVDAGAAGFAINLELYSEAAARRELGGKFQTTRASFEATVLRSVELMGNEGRVRSLIIPGLESPEDTVAGVDYLASLGCDPVLSPFRPAQGIDLMSHEPPAATDLRSILDESRAIAASHGVRLGPDCSPCQHNTLTFPWDARDLTRKADTQ